MAGELPANQVEFDQEDSEAAGLDVLRSVVAAQDEYRWQRQANCLGVDPDLFFPERGYTTSEAIQVCNGCVVREECLESLH